jgi:two-component system, NtrC family, sensor kinase
VRRILVVDDSADFAASLVALLEMCNFSAYATTDVAQALDALDGDAAIDMVVSDVRMPSVDGLDFVRVVRHRFPGLPVALMTGLPLAEEDGIPHGVAVLEKPFEIAKLVAVIERCLAKPR